MDLLGCLPSERQLVEGVLDLQCGKAFQKAYKPRSGKECVIVLIATEIVPLK
jgi:hypothetical protein